MNTKSKTFDAVAESRKWREATSRKLDAMTPAERLEYLENVRERYATEHAAWKAKQPLETASSS
jgi:hypothetical protein